MFDGRFPLYALLMYTSEDKAVAKYVREHYREVEKESTQHCLVFFADNPRYWQRRLEPKKYWEKLGIEKGVWEGFLNTVPYEPEHIYTLTEKLDISKDDLPCFAFFRKLDSEEIIPIRIDRRPERIRKVKPLSEGDVRIGFREIFSVIKSQCHPDEWWKGLRRLADKGEGFSNRRVRLIHIGGALSSIILATIEVLRYV